MSYERFTNQGKKASLKEMMEAEESALHNSNMLNIVSSIKLTKQCIEEHEYYLKFYKEKLQKLEEFGESGDMSDTQTVKELHGSRPKEFKPRNW